MLRFLRKRKNKQHGDITLIQLSVPGCRWSPFPELPQERSSVNLVSCGGQLYTVGGFALVESENECAPGEIIDIWLYVLILLHYMLQYNVAQNNVILLNFFL